MKMLQEVYLSKTGDYGPALAKCSQYCWYKETYLSKPNKS